MQISNPPSAASGPTSRPLRCVLSGDVADPALAANSLLARITYGPQDGAPFLNQGCLCLDIQTHGDHEPVVESWYGASPLHWGTDGLITFTHNEQFLFGAAFLPSQGVWANITCQAYLDLFRVLRQYQFDHLVRVWTLIPAINQPNAQGMENYRDFCIGRAQALDTGVADAMGMPAATVVGSRGHGISLYFVATRLGAPALLENARQVPASRYPLQYGPRAPLFARGSVLRVSAEQEMVFVSGTASILGHETVHHGDVERQCHVALGNIAHLIGADNLAEHGLRGGYALADLSLVKVYYRREADLPQIQAALRAHLGADTDRQFILADICREDLLVEVEAVIAFAR